MRSVQLSRVPPTHAKTTGDELTISYLGREEFAPAAARQAVLHERWGFTCGCERCAVEAAAPREVTQAVENGYARVMQVSASEAA